MRPEVGAGDLSSALEPKSLWHLRGCGRGDQGAPEPGALEAQKLTGTGRDGQSPDAALLPAHHEVLAFWGTLSPPLTRRPGLCHLQFFLPDVGEAAPMVAIATNARGNVLEGAQHSWVKHFI